ncbi:MAG: bifunctional alpha,alpha-trehalose-phosphate synthase (UDP-forming)/trehalose-phosphatase [Chloroflexi bacterium]|nr:bifunctional alpha,alpha-trehalose-phosphate synthase (UDP-forming)/trehalose-phosphatase [Chloroflexota bacterium]
MPYNHTAKDHRLLVVANRLPVTVEERDSELRFSPSTGGLATGLGAFYRDYRGLWVGWPGSIHPAHREAVEGKLASEWACHPVFLPERVVEEYYEGFANKTLWPLFHSMSMYAKYSAREWEAYKEANARFCEAVLDVVGPNDSLWVHDYQLLLLPQYLRNALPNTPIGFFLHIPFPPYEVLRLLPWHREIMEGLLGADLIGFHTYEYMQAFLGSVRRLLGYDNDLGRIIARDRVVLADVFPMGIDFLKFSRAIARPEVEAQVERIKAEASPCRIVLAVSRLDYTKGIPEYLEAIDDLLDRFRVWHKKVIFVLVVAPSRERVERYGHLKREIDELVGRINSKHGTVEWTPVRYLYRSLGFEELSALYASAAVAAITPLRDGMNLTAKEYIATRGDGTGVLVLSDTAGTAKELTEAIIVNPNSKEDVAEALHQALTMPEEEQRRRMVSMRSRLERHTVRHWAERFLQTLRHVVSLSQELSVRLLAAEEKSTLLDHYAQASQRLVLLDYDGTLTDFAEHPLEARPSPQVLRLLQGLAAQPGTEVMLLSGRDRKTFNRWFGHLDLTLGSEHGGWMKKRRSHRWEATVKADTRWKSRVRPILELFTERVPGSFIEEKALSLAWHFRKAEVASGDEAARELLDALTNLTANLPIHVLPGNKVVEVLSSGIGKGAFYTHHLARRRWDFILALGDDWTDESLFSALPATAYSIRVGLAASAARFNLRSSQEALALLAEMASRSSASLSEKDNRSEP